MRLLKLSPARVPEQSQERSQNFADAVLDLADGAGHETACIVLEDRETDQISGLLAGFGLDRNDQGEQQSGVAARILRFAPHILIATATQADGRRAEAPTFRARWRPLLRYQVFECADGVVALANLETGRRVDVPVSEPQRALDLIHADALARIRADPGTVKLTGSDFDVLAAAQGALDEWAARRPKRVDSDPVVACAGALESVLEDDILVEETLWVKGWIDWRPRRFSKMILRLENREWQVEIAGPRGDVDSVDALGFGAEIELGDARGSARLSLWLVDHTGLRRKWIDRRIWISPKTPVRSVTPLVRGEAEVRRRHIRCAPICEDRRIVHLAAWQSGRCIARWSDEAGLPASGVVDLDVSRTLSGSSLVHLHLTLEDARPTPWLALDPATGLPVAAKRFDNAAVIDKDSMTLASFFSMQALPDGAVSFTLDGKPVARRAPGGDPALVKIDFARSAGLAILEAEGPDGWRRAIRIFRARRERAGRCHLPAFVLPPGRPAAPTVAEAGETPRVVLIRQSSAPTDELYVLSGLEARAARGEVDLRIVDLDGDATDSRARADLLTAGAVVIVSRYLTDPWIESVAKQAAKLAGVFYVMDDDVTMAENDVRMPGGYRKRMIDTAQSDFQAMLHLSTRFVVTSEALDARFASAKTDLLTPPYIRPCETLTHLDDLSEIRIEYHGTQVHRADLDAIVDALITIHDEYPHTRLRTFMGIHAPRRLRRLERVDIMPEQPWPAYRETVAASRAHIGLAPMLTTPYNLAKSFVKIMDIARLGAAGLYSRSGPYAAVVTHGKDGLLLENDAQIWRYALAWLIENPAEIRKMALAGQDLARRLSERRHPTEYWRDALFGDAAGTRR